MHVFTVAIPGRNDWVFTGALAKPSFSSKVIRYHSGTSDRLDDYETEDELVSDEEEEIRATEAKRDAAKANAGRKRGKRSGRGRGR